MLIGISSNVENAEIETQTLTAETKIFKVIQSITHTFKLFNHQILMFYFF